VADLSNAQLLKDAHAQHGAIVAVRRDIHAHPEMRYEEVRTGALVAERLRALGYDVRTGVGKTGVVGTLTGGSKGKTVLLRGDMDALPIQETVDTPFKSQNDGVMHACGHDGHTAMLLGAAQLLAERRELIPGNVKLMFQPAEEGGAGAMRMIEDGVLQGPDVDGAFALHVSHRYYTGSLGIKAGPLHACSDYVTIEVQGKGGHASIPDVTVDPILIGAQIVASLQTLVSREVSPFEPAVITVGSFHAGTRPNIIPDTAHIEGTIRTHSTKVQELLERRIPELVQGIARAMRGDAKVDYTRLYPVVNNAASAADVVRSVAQETVGEAGTLEDRPIMGGEDFAFILQRVPGAMFQLGVRNRAWTEPREIHTARFELDEDALPIGAAMLAGSALRFLEA